MSPTRVGLASGIVLLLLVGGFVMATTYVPTDLGDLPGGDDESWGRAINASGQVVGHGRAATGERGFLWSNGVMTDIGDLPGGHSWGAGGDDMSRAEGINASGQVVGHSDSSLNRRGFLWDNGVMTDVGDLTSWVGGWVQAWGVNDNGQVVGVSQYQANDNHPFLWDNGVMTDLGELPGAVTGGGGRGQANAINKNGQVVGRCKLPAGYRAFLWQNGTITDLGALPDGDGTSEAWGINASSQIVGFSMAATNYHAVLWQNGTITDLGVLPGGNGESQAHGINASGQVVGFSGGFGGIVWDAVNGMQNLKDMLPESEAGNWTIWDARAINDAGQIVGRGNVPSGAVHAILLTPVEAPVIADVADRSITEGQAYAVTPSLVAGDAADTWSLISGPSGLAVEASTGAVSWASPTSTGSPFTVTIRATNVDGSDDETWQLTVPAPAAAGPCAAAPPMVLLPVVGGLLLLRRGGPRRRR